MRVTIGCLNREAGSVRDLIALMSYRIVAEPEFVRAELSGCETGEELRSFLDAVVRDNEKHRRPQILILVRSSKPIFQVMSHRLVECLEAISMTASRQIALVGDTADLRMSQEYMELIARQRGLNVRSFSDEAAAVRWLKDRRESRDRRVRRERRAGRPRRLRQIEAMRQEEQRLRLERRAQSDRRQRRRRVGASLH